MDISYSFVYSNHDVTITVHENLTLSCILQAKCKLLLRFKIA